MPETYTVKEIAEAIAWQDHVCFELTGRLSDEEINDMCSRCPIGEPCCNCTKEGMENIMRKWKEAKSRENA